MIEDFNYYYKNNKFSKKQKVQLLWKFGFLLLITGVGIQSYYYQKRIKEAPFNSEAEIISVVNCYKNGRCIEYKYSYNGRVYKDRANSNWGFSNWCENRYDCKGLKFKITLNMNNPE